MTRHFQEPLALSILACVLVSKVVSAQQYQPDFLPDGPELYYSFIFFMEDFGKWLDANNQQRPAHKADLMQSAARYLKVDVNELLKIVATCTALAVSIRQLETQMRNDVQTAIKNGNPPDYPARQVLAAKHQAAIQDAINQMQTAISLASWIGLKTYINGEHRASVHKAQ
jgi:AraC-like DNA-binding protein